MVPGPFPTIESYSSCSLSCHSRTIVMVKCLHKNHRKRVNNYFQTLAHFSLSKNQSKFSFCGSRRCPFSTVRGSCRCLWAHLRESCILAGPVWIACENAWVQILALKQTQNLKFANENKKLNHEKVEDRELTSLTETVCQMVARTFYNRALNFKGKRGVLG
jgi:hypothetical protein